MCVVKVSAGTIAAISDTRFVAEADVSICQPVAAKRPIARDDANRCGRGDVEVNRLDVSYEWGELLAFEHGKSLCSGALASEMLTVFGRIELASEMDVPPILVAERGNVEGDLGQDLEIHRRPHLWDRERDAIESLDDGPRQHDGLVVHAGVRKLVERGRRSDAESARQAMRRTGS